MATRKKKISPSPEFKTRLKREIRLFIRELKDGCVDYLDTRKLCDECAHKAVDVTYHPRKYITIKTLKPETKEELSMSAVLTIPATAPEPSTEPKSPKRGSGKGKGSTSPAVDQSFFDVARDKIAFEQLVEECGGNFADEQALAAATELAKEVADAEGKKLDGWIWWHEQTKAKLDLFLQMKSIYAKKALAAENLADWQKSVFFNHLVNSKVDEIPTPLGRKIALQTNSQPAPVILDAGVDETKLPDALTNFILDIVDRDALIAAVLAGKDVPGVAVRREADFDAIRDEINAGFNEIPFAKLGERGKHVRVR